MRDIISFRFCEKLVFASLGNSSEISALTGKKDGEQTNLG